MTGVLKKDQVKLSGTRVLTAPVGVPAAAHAAGPQARIVEQAGTTVVVEVICECGKKIYLNCECN